MKSRRRARISREADSSRRVVVQSAPWQSGGGTIVRQSTDVPAVAGSHYARTWHNQTLFTRFDVTGGRAGHDQPFRQGRAARRLPRDAADRRAIFPGTPGGQAVPPRSQPRQQPGSSAWPGLGRPLQRHRTFASSRTRDLTTFASQSPGITTPAPHRNFESSPSSSRELMSSSMPACGRSWAF